MPLAFAVAAAAFAAQAPVPPVSALAFHPDGKTLAVGGYEEVLIWDVGTAKVSKRIPVGGQARALAYSKDGRMLAVADGVPGSAGAVRILAPEPVTLEQAKDEMFCVAFSPDGKFLAAGGVDGLVRVWSVEDRKPVATLKDHSDWITGVAFSPDGKLFASASADKTVRVWEAGSWKSIVQLPEPLAEPVRGLAFSPDGALLAFAEDAGIRIWRTDTAPEPKDDAGKARRKVLIRQTRPIDAGGTPLGVIWSRANRMYVPSTNKTVRALGANGGVLATLSGHTDWVYAVAASPDGSKIASGSGDGTVKLWNAANGKLLATLAQPPPRVKP